MALFSNKIETAKFVDRKEKTIEVLYKQNPESETLSAYIVELDYNNQDFLDLLNELTIEEIQDNTKNYYDNMRDAMHLSVEEKAKVYFAEWVKVAQEELNRQDEERYAIFEKYKEEQLAILQVEIDEQVERRVQKGYDGVQAVIDQQYKEVDEYKEKQLSILQSEIDAQVEERYKEADEYAEQSFANVDKYREETQQALDKQVEQRYKEADKYKKEQLDTLQIEVDAQIESRYKEADQYLEEQKEGLQDQIEEMKDDLLSKYRLAPKNLKITPDKVADYMVNNFKDEDLVFKTKLAIFNLPEVKNSKDREMKMKVRKAKTIPELFKVYDDIQCNHS